MSKSTDPTPRLRDSPAFVVHALNGYEIHAERTRQYFAEQGMAFEWATAGDISLMTDEVVDHWFTPEFRDSRKRVYLSCTLNHLLLYEQFVQSDASTMLVFEDDVVFLRPFLPALDRLQSEVDQLPPGWLLSLENSTLRFPSFGQTRRGQHLYRAESGRCTAAYAIDRTAAERMLAAAKRARLGCPIGHWHNELAEAGELAIYWVHPTLIEQASHNGMLQATVSTHARSWPRRVSWLTQRTLKSTFGRILPQRRLLD